MSIQGYNVTIENSILRGKDFLLQNYCTVGRLICCVELPAWSSGKAGSLHFVLKVYQLVKQQKMSISLVFVSLICVLFILIPSNGFFILSNFLKFTSRSLDFIVKLLKILHLLCFLRYFMFEHNNQLLLY